MRKRSVVALSVLTVVLVLILLGGTKALQIRRMIAGAAQFAPPPEPVTVVGLQRQSWESVLSSVGSLAAVQGVTVSAELTGKVVRVAFEAGTLVRAGALLVQQDVASETAQLRAIEARLALAASNLDRARRLLAKHALPPSEYDLAAAQASQAQADADALRATITKKTIRAPFAGRLGLRQVNLGQVINAGEPIVLLQSIDPVFVNFLVPQQHLAQVTVGLPIRISSNTLPGPAIAGTITAITPQVDASTRSIELQGTVANPDERLRPGMFVNVTVVLPRQLPVLALPATAVLYAPYSDSVFVVETAPPASAAAAPGAPPAAGSALETKAGLVVRQQFVRLGERRGDYVAVLDGLKPGETVVTTGVFKLRNGQAVVVDNTLSPTFSLAPKPSDN
ncbi:MAG: efflux RND transporter periplasmic adaptor subunit [Proteobacteria bacterium]|nr:efflux RND transporter periplasmic adaptor subunit [Pseudomonadota bacterium]